MERFEDQVRRWAAAGINLIQIREKSLEPGALLALAEAARRTLDQAGSATKLLINGRADVAIAARADGVHVTAHPDELTPQQVRTLYAHARLQPPAVSVSCHTVDEVARARDNGADLILFGPVFEKRVGHRLVASGVGLAALGNACQTAKPLRVLALGGITTKNASACVAAGVAGIAGIRTFQ